MHREKVLIMVFKYYKGEENTVVVEKKDYDKSLFFEQYVQALRLLTDYIDNPKDEIPNIIAFCGDRGEGKTSCMMSVSYMVENCHKEEVAEEIKKIGVNSEILKNACFKVLPIIDPAFFDKEHNIIELLLGNIYSDFKKWIESNKGDINYQLSNTVSKLFQRTKQCLLHIGKTKTEMYDPLEELEALSAGVELNSNISNLLENYLRLIGKKKILVCIDDIDLNMSRAYQMCEEIRKYINNKYCVIMMSIKDDQLISAVENAIHNDADFPNDIDFNAMATKYVSKFIPVSVRVNMPKAYDLCDYELEVYESRDKKCICSYRSVKSGVVRRIFDTSRFLFYNSKGGISPIVPNNLRSLTQLLSLLFSMNEYNEDRNVLEANKHLFKAYFYKSWIKQLSPLNQRFAMDLAARQDGNDFNKYVVAYLGGVLKKTEDINDNGFSEIKDNIIVDIINKSNYGYNISVGDVLYLVNYLEQISSDEELKLVLFFIKSIYSIKLYEKYDVVTNDLEKELYPEANTDGNLYKSDVWFEHTNVLQRFVSGSYFNYSAGSLISNIKNSPQSRDYKVINGKKGLTDLLLGIGIVLKANKYASFLDTEKAKFQLLFRMAEFFIITTTRNIRRDNINDEVPAPIDKTSPVPYYLTSFNGRMGYYVFDVLAPFYSLTNIKYAYKRFEELADIYDFALNNEWSLLRQMINEVRNKELADNNIISDDEQKKYHPIEKDIKYWEWRLLSNAVLRNSEVALAVMENCRSFRFSNKSSGVSRELISEFYKKIINSNMMTYNRGENQSPYFINFVFLQPIVELLRNKELDSSLSITFDNSSKIVFPSFDNIFMYVPKTKSDNSIKADELFRDTLYNYQMTRGARVIDRVKDRQPDLYDMVSDDQWRKWFKSDTKYPREEIIRTLQSNIKYFNNSLRQEDDEE